VLEYGGAPVAIRDGVAFFTNIPDLRIYKVEKSNITAVTPGTLRGGAFLPDVDIYSAETPQFRFANLTLHPSYLDLMVAIREDHSNPSPADVIDTVVSLNLKTGLSKVISAGWDFYANPVFNPTGTKLAWLRWNHPDMPFRSTQLVVGDVHLGEDGHISISNEIEIAGERHISVAQQPLWTDANTIIFLHDISGWTQPWIHVLGGDTRPILNQPILGEFAEPMWWLGMSSYAILDADRLLCSVVRRGFASFIIISISSGTFEELPSDFVEIKNVKRIRPNEVVFVGCKIDAGEAIVKLTLHREHSVFEVLASSSKIRVPDGFATTPSPLVLTDSMGRDLNALFFPPHNPGFVGPPGEKPPCVIHLHSGPTARITPQFSWERMLYTSRGWGWCALYITLIPLPSSLICAPAGWMSCTAGRRVTAANICMFNLSFLKFILILSRPGNDWMARRQPSMSKNVSRRRAKPPPKASSISIVL
jgi:hypothetical protein